MGGKFKYVTLLIWLQLSLIGFLRKHMKKEQTVVYNQT